MSGFARLAIKFGAFLIISIGASLKIEVPQMEILNSVFSMQK